jgi:hypothetical protein
MSWEEELAKAQIASSAYGPQQKSYLTSDSGGYVVPSPSIGANSSSQMTKQSNTGEQAAQIGASGMLGAAVGGPVGAAIEVGGTLLAQSMAAEAQAKQAQRQRAIEIAQQHSQGERQGIDQMLSAWRSALR